MGIFYTGKGDKGTSDLGGKKIQKTQPEVEVLGTLDELNSLLGLVKNQSFGEQLNHLFPKIITDVQQDLFIIQANVAALMLSSLKGDCPLAAEKSHSKKKSSFVNFTPPPFPLEKVKKLEKLIDDFEKKVKPERKFIIYGANEGAAWLDYARAVARRTERTSLKLKNKLLPEMIAYLNRLSSLLFAMARLAVKKAGQKEEHPTYR